MSVACMGMACMGMFCPDGCGSAPSVAVHVACIVGGLASQLFALAAAPAPPHGYGFHSGAE